MVAAQDLGDALKSYTVVEPDPKMALRLRTLWRIHGRGVPLEIVSSVSELNDQYDLIVLSHVLEHIGEPEPFLESIKRTMHSESALFIEIPLRDDRYKTDVYGHVHFFEPKHLEALIKGQGYNLLSLASYGRDPESTPLAACPPLFSRIADRLIYKARPALPFGILSAAYGRLYGVNQKNPKGTWIRAIASLRK